MNLLNNSKIFVGCIMLLMNLGSRYIAHELPSNIDEILNRKWVRIVIICGIIFVATRDIKISILLTLLFVLVFKFLLDEKSTFYILGEKEGQEHKISKTEATKAYNVLRQFQKEKSRTI